MSKPLSLTAQRVLEALALFRYCTARQMIAAGACKDYNHLIRSIIPELMGRRPALVECKDFGPLPGKGRLARLYSLASGGAEALADLHRRPVTEFPFPTGGIQFTADYFHRVAYVDFCIALHRWTDAAGYGVLSALHYFDKTGSNRRGEGMAVQSRVDMADGRFIIPDGVFLIDVGEKRRAFAVEIHNETDTKRVVRQLEGHLLAIGNGAVSHKVGHDMAAYVFSVSTDRGLMERVRTRIAALPTFAHVHLLFCFNSLDTLKEGFSDGWTLADGSPAPVFG